MRPGRGVADRRAYLRVVDDRPSPAFMPEQQQRAEPVGLYIAGAVALSWFACIGIAWTAYAICRATGVCKP